MPFCLHNSYTVEAYLSGGMLLLRTLLGDQIHPLERNPLFGLILGIDIPYLPSHDTYPFSFVFLVDYSMLIPLFHKGWKIKEC